MLISNACPVQFWPSSAATFNETEVAGINPACYSQIFNAADTIVIQFADSTAGSYNLQVLDSQQNQIDLLPFVEIATGVWQISYQPSLGSPAINNQEVQLKILGDSLELLKSDSIDIRQNHHNSLLIQYSNSNKYAGLDFVAQSPEVIFYLRLQARFFHEEPVTEQEDLELSDDTIQVLWSKVGKKKLLEIGFVPYYMHEKIVLILGCQYITIEGKDWLKQDSYDIELGNKRYPLKRANVKLTDQDYIKRNLL